MAIDILTKGNSMTLACVDRSIHEHLEKIPFCPFRGGLYFVCSHTLGFLPGECLFLYKNRLSEKHGTFVLTRRLGKRRVDNPQSQGRQRVEHDKSYDF